MKFERFGPQLADKWKKNVVKSCLMNRNEARKQPEKKMIRFCKLITEVGQ